MSADNKKQEGSTEPTPKCSDDTPNLPTVQVMYRAQLINEPTQTEGEKKSDGPPKLPTLPSLVTKPQMQHFQDLGLGKGVNIADPKPWANRSSFQVRNVTEDIHRWIRRRRCLRGVRNWSGKCIQCILSDGELFSHPQFSSQHRCRHRTISHCVHLPQNSG